MSFAQIYKQTLNRFISSAVDPNRMMENVQMLKILCWNWKYLLISVPADRELHIFSRNGSEGPWEYPRRPVLPDEERKNRIVTGSEAPDLSSEHHKGGNNILIYVSVLAAVVLGLLIYVAYKWWGAWWWDFTIIQHHNITFKDVDWLPVSGYRFIQFYQNSNGWLLCVII